MNPVDPEYAYEEGLVFIEGFASSITGASYVTINESVSEYGVRGLKFISGALVTVQNAKDGSVITFAEEEDTYLSPPNFRVFPGQEWKLNVVMPDGRAYESEPEIVIAPVAMKDVIIEYDKELEFQESLNKFVPGHRVSVGFDDPQEEENYYYWSYRSFENLDYCVRCNDGIFRNGECMPYDLSDKQRRYFDYICETDCWTIRYSNDVNIYDDSFSNGQEISKLEIAKLPLYSRENMVVEVQQFSLNPAAYKYYEVLKDIVDNSSGFNAPPPAALIGNLYNANNPYEFVLGRFTAAASSVTHVFVERTYIDESPLESLQPPEIETEPIVFSPYPEPWTQLAPCEESRYRTAIRPVGWQ